MQVVDCEKLSFWAEGDLTRKGKEKKKKEGEI